MNRVNAGAYCIRPTLTAIIAIATAFTLTACGGDNDSGEADTSSSSAEAVHNPSSSSGGGNLSSSGGTEPLAFEIEGLTYDNYPKVDGSTSTNPLNRIIAAKLMGLEYEWRNNGVNDISFKNSTMLPEDFKEKKLQCNQTHGAIINLIDSKADLIIVARKMSEDEKQHADSTGVSLTETPIALDALDFIIHVDNSANSLTVEQIQDIYLIKITNWDEVGGGGSGMKENITPFIRNANSGSQEMMNEIVMNREDMPSNWEEWPDEVIPTIGSMIHVYEELMRYRNGICFTPHYYKEYMVNGMDQIKTLAINGIPPNETTIENKSYPFVANVYASIRSDLDRSSTAYKLYELLQAKAGKEVIRESGYVPN